MNKMKDTRTTLEQYKENMERKYKKQLGKINTTLLETDSFLRGKLLFNILNNNNLAKELKYYVFTDWWTSIEAGHEKFDAEIVRDWLEDTNVELDFSNLNVDKNDEIEVYRGINECSLGWDGLSWTTDKDIAKKFANGARIRHQTSKPEVLVGKVSIHDILAIINSRNESEILCNEVFN